MTSIDVAIVALYAVVLFGLAQWVSRDNGQDKTTEDYFLAGRTLPWWAIGASLIAANISAEQIIGQSGQGFVVGLAIAAYEWQAAIVLLIVAKSFLPIFLKHKIYTMPQFLQTRYGSGVKSLMSFYWIVLYTAVNLTAVLWLGGLAIESLTGVDVFSLCVVWRRLRSCTRYTGAQGGCAHGYHSGGHPHPWWFCHHLACPGCCGAGRGRYRWLATLE